MWTTRAIGGVVIMVAGVLGPAHAQPAGDTPSKPWDDHPFGAEVELGDGTPAGVVGVGIDWTPVPWFSLEAKLGIGRTWALPYDFPGTVQGALMGRLRWVYGGWGVSVGAGASTGEFDVCQSCPFENGDHWSWSSAVWFDTELALEHRWTSGVGLRLAVGLSRMLNPGAATCDAVDENCQSPPEEAHHAVPYLGIGFRVPLATRSH